MPLGIEVGLGPGDIVLDVDPAPPKKGTAAPTFRPMSLVAKVAKRSHISALVSRLLVGATTTTTTTTDYYGP